MELGQIIFYGFTIAIAFGISMIVSMIRKETIKSLQDEVAWLRDQYDREERFGQDIRDLQESHKELYFQIKEMQDD